MVIYYVLFKKTFVELYYKLWFHFNLITNVDRKKKKKKHRTRAETHVLSYQEMFYKLSYVEYDKRNVLNK